MRNQLEFRGFIYIWVWLGMIHLFYADSWKGLRVFAHKGQWKSRHSRVWNSEDPSTWILVLFYLFCFCLLPVVSEQFACTSTNQQSVCYSLFPLRFRQMGLLVWPLLEFIPKVMRLIHIIKDYMLKIRICVYVLKNVES